MGDILKNALNKLKDTWSVHNREVLLFLGVMLVGIIGFEAGLVQGQSFQSKPLVIEKPASPPVSVAQVAGASDENGIAAKKIATTTQGQTVAQGVPSDQSCKFVGSRNSDKYHLPTCSFAKRIKPENRVCFSSEEDAKARGYKAGCLK